MATSTVYLYLSNFKQFDNCALRVHLFYLQQPSTIVDWHLHCLRLGDPSSTKLDTVQSKHDHMNYQILKHHKNVYKTTQSHDQ